MTRDLRGSPEDNAGEWEAGKPSRIDPVTDATGSDALIEDTVLRATEQGISGPDLVPGPSKEETLIRAKLSALRTGMEVLRKTGGNVLTTLDQRGVVREILGAAIEGVEAERGILFVGEGDEAGLVPVMTLRMSGEEVEGVERVSRQILREARRSGIVITHDALYDERFHQAHSVQVEKIRAVICAPLMVRGKPLGILYLDTPAGGGSFPSHSRSFIEAFVELAAIALENARVHEEVCRENTRLRRRLTTQESFSRILSHSPQMDTLYQRAILGAQVDAPILLTGESGSGKELLARTIHENSARELHSFVAASCGAMPSELVDSLLFGRATGAGPGVYRALPGLFQLANRGTLFLNEIADLDLSVQATLLRAIEDGHVASLRSKRQYRTDVHLICGTSRDIREDVREGRFLEDLFYQVSVLELSIPPLRERPEDIPLLIDHFIQKHTREDRIRGKITFTKDAVDYLETLPWRGNMKELERLIHRVILQSNRSRVDAGQLKKLIAELLEKRLPGEVPGAWPGLGRSGQVRPFAEQEREALREALIRAGWNKSRAARLLGLHRNTLLRRMRKLRVSQEE